MVLKIDECNSMGWEFMADLAKYDRVDSLAEAIVMVKSAWFPLDFTVLWNDGTDGCAFVQFGQASVKRVVSSRRRFPNDLVWMSADMFGRTLLIDLMGIRRGHAT